MAARGSILGRKQEEAIAALLTQRNVEEAARAARIGTRTLLRWLKLPDFQAAYRQVRNPVEGDHDSGAKPIGIPAGSRSPFRSEADQ